jgi:kynurenine formamidase
MSFVWLSHVLSNNTPLYGGADNLEIIPDKSIQSGDSCNTSFIKMPSHAGTHVDAPRHFISDGRTIDSFSASEWIFHNPCIINIDIPPGTLIEKEHIINYNISEKTDFIILKTGFENCREDDIFWQQSPGLAPELAEFLLLKCPHLRAVGMDFISISSLKHRDKGRMAHREFLQRGILIFEDMRLSELHLQTQLRKVIALPLRFKQGDGAPVTIMGVIDEDI